MATHPYPEFSIPGLHVFKDHGAYKRTGSRFRIGSGCAISIQTVEKRKWERAVDLYYSPGACSIGIHVLLEEIGKPYELHKVSLKDGEQYKPEFLAINPKAKVPTLVREDGTVL